MGGAHLLLVYEGLNLAPDAFQDAESEVLFISRKSVLQEAIEAVEVKVERVYGAREKRKSMKKRLNSKRSF